jgi:hypothetical protein
MGPSQSAGGSAQQRYERVRAYALTPANDRPRVSPAQFDLRRLQRFGLLGLVDGIVWRPGHGDFEVQLVPLGADDAEERLARLCELLGTLLSVPGEGGGDATSSALRAGVDGAAGAGADDREPACRDHAAR